ncbi:hypothetical protein A1O1_02754 [Capronia coronata CBS 617.96]|uniref:HTH myb-type domain-containing protein n=1 Tax=Capronia coronata CBS 617.96 TaxID=1182541 RepID=W9YXH8_9EURO|nr:uncharacterized protein A1O1_02754 [Capronia coronata CBS 617.96]EXJ94360.1 hypothetical protein A1O1_02754 [Capronia coronata CBS 617.96]
MSLDISAGQDSHTQPAPLSTPIPDPEPDDNPRSPKRRRITPSNAEEEAVRNVIGPAVSQGLAELQREGDEKPQRTQADSLPSGIAGNRRDHVATNALRSQSPAEKSRLEHLTALDGQASQILSFLARLTPSEALGLSNTPNSPSTREYAAMRSTFDQTRRMFNTGKPFLSSSDLGLRDLGQIEILRKANQAIFMSSVFTGEIGLRDMDRMFLSVFVPDNGKLLKAQASIYLELKTQGFITAWRTGAAPPAVVMADLFGPDLDKAILARRPGTTALAPSEQDFLNRLSSRRDILLNHVKNNTLDQLPFKYRWEDFSREVSSYLSKNIESAAHAGNGVAEAHRNNPTRALQRGQMEGQFSIHTPPLPVASNEAILPVAPQPKPSTDSLLSDDFVAQAARAAEIAMQDAGGFGLPETFNSMSSPTNPAVPLDTPTSQPGLPDYQPFEPIIENVNVKPDSTTAVSGALGEIPHASQTAPTSVLYERARLAATTKAALVARKGVTPSQRRPWTTEEENALMTGLDRVKGPHWSQILAMYGPGGTVSEALKDRNQVQLKDKARNLKLFFLKSGIEVPYYLKYVTGDLKTRAPGQASKQEARERDRLLSEGDAASFDALQEAMALGGADQQISGAAGSSASQSNLESDGGEEFGQGSPQNEGEGSFNTSMDDVEAMIARAAAQASQSLGPDWP